MRFPKVKLGYLNQFDELMHPDICGVTHEYESDDSDDEIHDDEDSDLEQRFLPKQKSLR